MTTTPLYTIRQASKLVNTPTSKIRYYCNAGLIPHLKRTKGGYRVLDENQLEWLRMIVALRKCGFEISDIKKYRKLSEQGRGTIPERKGMLETKRRQIWQEIEDMQENISFIERQMEIFDQTPETQAPEAQSSET